MTRGKVIQVPQTSPRNGQVFKASRLELLKFILFLSLWHVRVHEVLITHQKLFVEALDIFLDVSQAILWLR